MTSLSIRSSNAIKSSPGKDINEVDPGCDNRNYEFIPVNIPVRYFLSKEHISQTVASIRRPELVLIFVCSLCVYFGLLSLRVFDDNKLTSWYWIFSNADLLTVSMYLASGLLVGLLFVNITLSRNQALISLILFSFMIPVFHWGNPEVILDAGRYFSQAKFLEIYGFAYFLDQWGKGIMAWTDLPLMPVIYGIIFKVFGEGRLGVQVINTIFFSGTVYVTYCLGRYLWGHRVGLYGAAMLLAIPYLHTQVPLMMVDIPAMFFLTLAVFLSVRAISLGGNGNAALAAAGIVLAMLSKYTNWIMLSVLPVISCVYYLEATNRNEKLRVFRQSRNIMAAFSLIAIIPLIWGYEIILGQINLLLNYQLAILDGWTESHLSTFLFQVHPVVSLAALASIYMAYKRRDKSLLIAGWMLLLVFAVDIERIRYVLIVFPVLSLMAGYAIAGLNKVEVRRYLALSVLITASTVSMLGHAAFLRSNSAANMQDAAVYVDNKELPTVEVIMLEQPQSSVNPVMSFPLLDLYTQKEVVLSELLGRGDNNLTESQLKSTLRFTWEYKIPEYYRQVKQGENNIVVVVKSKENQVLPGVLKEKLTGYYKDKTFNKDEGIFRYKSIVDIYLPSENGE